MQERPVRAETTDNDAARGLLPALYDSAADLAMRLERGLTDAAAALTPGEIGAFNQILADARRALPDSAALREDVADIDEATRPADAYRALHTTIVPTLHNALPPQAYDERG
jgi:hypothetical protein